MSRSTLSDTDILRLTEYSDPDSKGRVQLKITLPSGRVVKSSDWIVPSEVKGRVLIAWANSIRDQDALDAQEREEQERLRAQSRDDRRSQGVQQASSSPGPAPSAEGVSAQTTLTSLPDDPADMIREKLTGLTERATELDKIISDHEWQRRETLDHIEKWTKVAEGLGIRLSDPTTTAVLSAEITETSTATNEESSSDSRPEEDPELDSSGSNSGGVPDVRPGPSKGKRGRSKRGPRSKRSAKRTSDGDAGSSTEAVKEKVDDKTSERVDSGTAE